MNIRRLVWLPFGELLHGETKATDRIFASKPGNPDWWEARAKILTEYTLPSLTNQMFPFEIWAGIAEESGKVCQPVVDALAAVGVKIVMHPARDATRYGKGVARKAVQEALRLSEYVVFAQIDSDDMYLDDALELIAGVRPKAGLVLMFRSGYVLNDHTKEMFIYNPKNCPPPFFARVYTQEYIEDPDAYEERWHFCLTHNKLLQSVRRHDLPDGRFVVVSHDRNTSSGWKRLLSRNRIGKQLSDDERDEVLRRCGQ